MWCGTLDRPISEFWDLSPTEFLLVLAQKYKARDGGTLRDEAYLEELYQEMING